MRFLSGRVVIGALLIVLSPLIPAGSAQQIATVYNVVQITGLSGVKEHAKGHLTVDKGNLQFSNSKVKADVAVTSVQDVVTGNDSQRMIRGFVGTLTMIAPYESGRFLSLFRLKLDTLTIQYRDADGGLHGAIFTMAVGKADPLKKELVAQGAHTSIPVQEDAPGAETKPGATKERKP
jgi:hypothetical protein